MEDETLKKIDISKKLKMRNLWHFKKIENA